jgi:hypothetical protein
VQRFIQVADIVEGFPAEENRLLENVIREMDQPPQVWLSGVRKTARNISGHIDEVSVTVY